MYGTINIKVTMCVLAWASPVQEQNAVSGLHMDNIISTYYMQNSAPSLGYSVVGNDMLWAVTSTVHSMRTSLWFVLLSDVHNIMAYKWPDYRNSGGVGELEEWRPFNFHIPCFSRFIWPKIYYDSTLTVHWFATNFHVKIYTNLDAKNVKTFLTLNFYSIFKCSWT